MRWSRKTLSSLTHYRLTRLILYVGLFWTREESESSSCLQSHFDTISLCIYVKFISHSKPVKNETRLIGMSISTECMPNVSTHTDRFLWVNESDVHTEHGSSSRPYLCSLYILTPSTISRGRKSGQPESDTRNTIIAELRGWKIMHEWLTFPRNRAGYSSTQLQMYARVKLRWCSTLDDVSW